MQRPSSRARSRSTSRDEGAYHPPTDTAPDAFDYCNAFWVDPQKSREGGRRAEGDAEEKDWGKEGYETVMGRVKASAKVCEDLRALLKERCVCLSRSDVLLRPLLCGKGTLRRRIQVGSRLVRSFESCVSSKSLLVAPGGLEAESMSSLVRLLSCAGDLRPGRGCLRVFFGSDRGSDACRCTRTRPRDHPRTTELTRPSASFSQSFGSGGLCQAAEQAVEAFFRCRRDWVRADISCILTRGKVR